MKRTMLILLVEETDEPDPIDTTGAEVEELSRVVRSPLKPTLARCCDVLQLAERKRVAK
jgi:hypothetical protein